MAQWEQAVQPWDLSSSVNDVSHSYMLIPKVSAVSALSQLAAKCRVKVTCKPGQLTHHGAQENNSELVWSKDAAGLSPFPQRNCRSLLPFPPAVGLPQQRGTKPPLPVAGLRWSPRLAAIAAPWPWQHAHTYTSIWTNASLAALPCAALLKSARGKSALQYTKWNPAESKLEHNGNWSAATYRPCRLYNRPAVFFRHIRLIVLSPAHGKIRQAFWKYLICLHLFKNC